MEGKVESLAYNVTRLGGTERPFSGKHYLEKGMATTTASVAIIFYSHLK